MASQTVVEKAVDFARKELGEETTGHDWHHIERVWGTTRHIAEEEGADMQVCELAALLHDIADEKLNDSEEEGLGKVRDWLMSVSLPDSETNHVMEIISTMSFKGGGGPEVRTLEGKVVQDADRLDAIGAIGIARAFTYAGAKGQPIFDPGLPPRDEMTKTEYRTGKSTAVNHFYEKLLKLKDLMNTETGMKMAEERHRFMVGFLRQFYSEWGRPAGTWQDKNN
ncbi:HD domain-containing protein [Bacillus marinisedimentorum]|uniref:HD domain-containing protein n=1 Tax=Bacillus marinisedimentorum TaxID=1821260 RepID=UPI0007DF7C1A|nr:HD domain-containing protein [Bacillus marinisedimentorum]